MKIPREQASCYGPPDVQARDSLLSSTSSHVNRPPSRDGDRAGDSDDSDAREVFLSARLVRQRYGDASQMWLWRRGRRYRGHEAGHHRLRSVSRYVKKPRCRQRLGPVAERIVALVGFRTAKPWLLSSQAVLLVILFPLLA